MAKLVKSIYTGSDVTALGELTAADTIEQAIIMADNTALTFGTDSDASIQYDETTDDRLEITGTTVYVGKNAVGVVTADNDSAFDLATGNFFTCTPTAAIDLSFLNETAGQSGMIYFNNGSNYTVTAAADVFISTDDLTAISATGVYLISYFCPDGTNVYLSASAALTEGS